MASFDDLPELETHAFVLVLGLLVTFWVYMKVKLLRERIALREEGEVPPEAPDWQHTLAGSRWTMPVLGVIALLLALGLAFTGVTR